MPYYTKIDQLVKAAKENNLTIGELTLKEEAQNSGKTEEECYARMEKQLVVMEQGILEGLNTSAKSPSGLTGGDAVRLHNYSQKKTIGGSTIVNAIAAAIAVSEVNANMGRIVAAPTAGSCGIMPGAIISIMNEYSIDRRKTVLALFTASAIGLVISTNATVAGAEGGCQAECGAASAMCAAALTEMFDGTPDQVAEAAALALKNLLGLACDPVAGLVEVPCVKRNGFCAAHSIAAADMALAGVESVIPPDEVIDAMYRIGKEMPVSVKETAMGGLATSPTGKAYAKKILG